LASRSIARVKSAIASVGSDGRVAALAVRRRPLRAFCDHLVEVHARVVHATGRERLHAVAVRLVDRVALELTPGERDDADDDDGQHDQRGPAQDRPSASIGMPPSPSSMPVGS
jgi:hypothetical protein